MKDKCSHFRKACNRKCISSFRESIGQHFMIILIETRKLWQVNLNSIQVWKKNLISQKCNLIATRLCYFPCNGIEEIISYRYIVLKFCLTDYQKQLMNFVKRLLNYSWTTFESFCILKIIANLVRKYRRHRQKKKFWKGGCQSCR